MSLTMQILKKEGNFEGRLIYANLHKKSVYLSSKVKNIEVSMLIDLRTTNLFMNSEWIRRFELTQESIKEIWMLFPQGRKTKCLVTNDMKFKSRSKWFQEEMTIFSLNGIYIVIRNTFLEFYGMES